MSSPENEKKAISLDLLAHRAESSASSSPDGGAFAEAAKHGKLQNPLARLNKQQVLQNARDFATEVGLEGEIDLIQRGALVAQNPTDYNNIEELSKEEKAALEHEVKHKWSHPIILYLTIFTCSIGAATQGWDQTGSNVSLRVSPPASLLS